MELTLVRFSNDSRRCLGMLCTDGDFECFTLEDTVRIDDPSTANDESKKVMGETAIPEGTYRIILNMSPKFGKIMPRLLDVPGFDGILIHKGNTIFDTKGCILVGDMLSHDSIAPGSSTPAFDRLFKKLEAASDIHITIANRF